MGEHLIAILSERASGELFNDDVCAALDIMMKHGVSLLRNDMKWKPIHNIHTYIRIHDVHVPMHTADAHSEKLPNFEKLTP